ncbi:hypothetical protein GALMADRAFT_715001 [Galerina marginata CBS 339.88]|uniref:Uncharacterized protein n=1 Tax=Galerina marginata (strain CBS 339.88) TaxID=685588 RepID=A0A067TMX2_GALM3|nr:hypothetical protein GALMADRAFT_715001 [Galerina marginata CBS 339.88]
MEQGCLGYPAPIELGIHNLPNELFLLIFAMNADMFSDINALKDTHRTALVSKKWRQILLDSPSIWGKHIDLNVLCKDTTVKEEWTSEILRRSTGALLWIRGAVSGRQTRMFFEPLIKNNWTQIQKLVVDVAPIDESSPTWQTILQPAPNLETFEVRFYHYNPKEGLNFHAPWTVTSEDELLFSRFTRDHLFANNAPSLREFVPTQIYFSPGAPWLSNVRSVSFTSPVSLHKVFQAIEQIPLLERLNLEELQYSPNQSKLPHLSFPRLTVIVLSDLLFVCSQVLNHITPAPGCSLSLDALDRPNDLLTTSVLRGAQQALSKYLKLFYQSHTAAQISLQCCSVAFSFIDTTTRFGVDPAFFIVNLTFGPMTFTHASFLDSELTAFNDLVLAFTINSTRFPLARTLDLHLESPTLYTSFLASSDFSAIEALHTQESSLTTIRKLKDKKLNPHSKTFPYPFPALKTLRVTDIKEPRCPIKVLEVHPATTHPRLGYLQPFWRILDQEMTGMAVKVLSQEGDGREVVCRGVNAYRLFLEY